EESFSENPEISAEESRPPFVEESFAEKSVDLNENPSHNGFFLVIAGSALAAVTVTAVIIVIIKRKKR
ncbi:MAG: hypothetical protein J6W15_00305, partial [Clostridia bacterium]|nr:hypothetical protein [Clostridia bacterium]